MSLALIVGAGAACGRSSDADPVADPGSYELVTPTAYRYPSGDGDTLSAELGFLRVPENRTEPGSRWISLAFMRIPASGSSSGAPIFFLEGGPGSAAIKQSRFELYAALRAFGDVVVLDQRGTGRSDPELSCPEPILHDPSLPNNETTAMVEYRTGARACADHWRAQGVDLQGYNTNESADDVDALRRALGLDSIRLVSMSYGSHLALATIRRHGSHIGRAVMAGIEGPDHTVKLPSRVAEYLGHIENALEADADARAVVPEFLALVETAAERLEQAPASATVTGADGELMLVYVTAYDLKRLVAGLVGRREFIATIPLDFAGVARGDYASLSRLFDYPDRRRIHAGGAALDCASGASDERWSRVVAERSTYPLGALADFPLPDACDAWGVHRLEASFRAPLDSDVPALFISGGLDGRTPPSNAEEVRAGFSTSGHIIVEGMGHNTTGLFLAVPRVMELIAGFLAGEPPASERVSAAPIEFSVP